MLWCSVVQSVVLCGILCYIGHITVREAVCDVHNMSRSALQHSPGPAESSSTLEVVACHGAPNRISQYVRPLRTARSWLYCAVSRPL